MHAHTHTTHTHTQHTRTHTHAHTRVHTHTHAYTHTHTHVPVCAHATLTAPRCCATRAIHFNVTDAITCETSRSLPPAPSLRDGMGSAPLHPLCSPADGATTGVCCSGKQHATASCFPYARCGCLAAGLCADLSADCCSGNCHKTALCGIGIGCRCD